MKQSRFDDDHHNTESIAQLLNSKMNSNTNTFRAKREEITRLSIPSSEDRITSQRQSLAEESQAVKDC